MKKREWIVVQRTSSLTLSGYGWLRVRPPDNEHTHAHARTLRTVTDMRNSSSMDGPANATHHERTRGEEGGSEENREWADEEERGLEAGDCSTPVVEWLAGEKRDGRLN